MRQKFGSSSGLKSSGKMQGIGSNGGGSSSSNNNDGTDVADVLADTSKLALSYVSSMWETTTKVLLFATNSIIRNYEFILFRRYKKPRFRSKLHQLGGVFSVVPRQLPMSLLHLPLN